MSSKERKGSTSTSPLCTCCDSACCGCFRKLYTCCCPYLPKKDPYAGVEYMPIDKPGPTRRSITAARQSISVPLLHFPHGSQKLVQPSIDEEDSDDLDYPSEAVTKQPKPLTQQYLSTSYPESVSEASGDASQHESEDEVGVELGFVEYQKKVKDLIGVRDARIFRTPEVSRENYSPSSDSSSHISQNEDTFPSASEPPLVKIRMRSFQIEPEATPHKPSVQFSLYFDEKHNTLIVHLLQALNLPTKRPQSTSNPFAEVYLLPHKMEVFETRVFQATLNPAFDQAFKFNNVDCDDLKKQMLVIRLYLHSKHHFLGGVLFPLEHGKLYGLSHTTDITVYDEEEGLKDNCKGDILLSITYHPEAGTLDILMLEANNLKKQDFIGLPNPYMKVNTFFEGIRISKWKTSAQRNTLNPVFNELCVLDIGSKSVDHLQVEIIVMDYDRFGRNCDLGSVTFGSNVDSESGKTYWNNIISNPNVSHMCWHVITSAESSSRLLRSPVHSRKKSPTSCVSAASK